VVELEKCVNCKIRQCFFNNLLHNQSFEGSAVETWRTSLVPKRIVESIVTGRATLRRARLPSRVGKPTWDSIL
jgi:hypothetical protein